MFKIFFFILMFHTRLWIQLEIFVQLLTIEATLWPLIHMQSIIKLWFNRGMSPKIQGFISGLFSKVCIDRLCQWESMMATLSPGLKHQCTMDKLQQI